MLSKITPLILTYNETPNIDRTLRRLGWAESIVVIDSFSEDTTLEIIKKYPQVEVFQRKFDNHTNQWNYGIDQVSTEWVLSMDADYVISPELEKELKVLQLGNSIDAYNIPFKYCVFGKPLRGTILPPRLALFHKNKARYIQDGHTQLLEAKGNTSSLKYPFHHDDRKSLSRWLWAQNRYMDLEVKKLKETPDSELSLGDKIRKRKYFAPIIIFFYCLIIKGGILDGWQGWYYAFQRMLAELLFSLKLMEFTFNEQNKK